MLYHFALLLPSMVSLFWAVFLLCTIKFNNFDNRGQSKFTCSAERGNCRMKSNRKSQYILAIGMFLNSLTFLNLAYYIGGVKDYTTYYILDIIDPAFFIPPVMYLYFKSLTSEKPFGWKDYLWFLPPLAIGGMLVLLYILMGEENAVRYSQDLLTRGTLLPKYTDVVYKLHYLLSVKLYSIVGLILNLGVCVYAFVSVIRYHYRLRDFYSSLDDKSISQSYGVLIWFIVASFSGLALFYMSRNFFLKYPVANIFIFTVLAIICFALCYSGYRIRYTATDLAADLAEADRASVETKPIDAVNATDEVAVDVKNGKYGPLAAKFNKLIDEDKIFLQCMLRADEVAKMLHSNRTYISRMIHEEFNSNFSDYINEKRIRHSKELMLLNPSMRINEIAEKSGFVNASSYSRTFKQIAGKPPREWLKDTYYGGVS